MTKEELDAMRLKASQTTSEPDEATQEEQEAEEPKEEGTAPVEAENPEPEPVEEKVEEPTVEQDPPRVPYSRFETVNEARIRAEQELELYKRQAEQEQLARAAAPTEAGLPAYWVKMYGDGPESKEAYALRQQEIAEMRESLEEGVRKSILQEQRQAEERTEGMVDDWSNRIDDYAAEHKRKFTDTETDAILDVMDELTPKDRDGNYIVEPIDYLDRAVELHDLRQEKAMATKKQAKRATVQLTEAKSEGNPLVTPTKEWTGDWRTKLARMGQ